MVYSTFSSIMTARSGINVAQLGMNVTTQNMANANTRGYTRQRLDTVSVGSYASQNIAFIGASVSGGTKAIGVTQIRDSYLDARFRSEMSGYCELDGQYSILSQLGDLFDQWNKDTGLVVTDKMFSDLIETLQNLTAEGANYGALATNQMELICSILNTYANGMEGVRQTEEEMLQNVDIPRVNDLLDEIAALSDKIQRAQATGQPDLELQDARNLLLDELSQYVDIKVTYSTSSINKNMQDIKIDLVNANGANYTLLENEHVKNKFVLIDADTSGSGKTQLWLDDGAGLPTSHTHITDDVNSGALKGVLDMLNCAGPFDGTDVKGLPYYEALMNSMVEKFADTLNTINGTDLFETSDSSGVFTLGNIKLVDGATMTEDKAAIAKMIEFLSGSSNEKYNFEVIDSNGNPMTVYTGTMQGYWGFIEDTLNGHIDSLKTQTTNKGAMVTTADNSRLSLSAVSMDEETVNLIMYQKAYNASSRMITTLDEALDQLINKTGVVGR